MHQCSGTHSNFFNRPVICGPRYRRLLILEDLKFRALLSNTVVTFLAHISGNLWPRIYNKAACSVCNMKPRVGPIQPFSNTSVPHSNFRLDALVAVYPHHDHVR